MGGRRLDKQQIITDYIEGKQTIAQLELKYGVSHSTICRALKGMRDKPWYDFERGFSAIKEAAETAPDNEPFCWYILGTMYLNGRKDIPRDPIQGKYWIDKAAAVGYHNAQVIQEIEWGNNPPGFKEWLGKRLEKEEQIRRIALPCIIMIVIALIAYFIFR